jgi:hypothetical protein
MSNQKHIENMTMQELRDYLLELENLAKDESQKLIAESKIIQVKNRMEMLMPEPIINKKITKISYYWIERAIRQEADTKAQLYDGLSNDINNLLNDLMLNQLPVNITIRSLFDTPLVIHKDSVDQLDPKKLQESIKSILSKAVSETKTV